MNTYVKICYSNAIIVLVLKGHTKESWIPSNRVLLLKQSLSYLRHSLLLWNQKVQYFVRKSLPLNSLLSQIQNQFQYYKDRVNAHLQQQSVGFLKSVYRTTKNPTTLQLIIQPSFRAHPIVELHSIKHGDK